MAHPSWASSCAQGTFDATAYLFRLQLGLATRLTVIFDHFTLEAFS